jgi:ketosteroid isomerase-like protein
MLSGIYIIDLPEHKRDMPLPSSSLITDPDPLTAVRQWFELLGHYCATEDYSAAHTIFAADVASFGTKAKIVSGIEPLQKNQWEGIWPNITDFRIERDSIHGGGDNRHAWGMAAWDSTGYDQQGAPFYRPGRATVVLQRRDGVWLALHTHFSLVPGTPPHTYGAGNPG